MQRSAKLMKHKTHILLIDDDPIFCMVIQDMLASAGYFVTSANSGLKGLKILDEHPTLFSLIILDRVMPEFSGLDVLHKLCRIPKVREIPVILLTGHANQKHTETAVTYGVFEVLKKTTDETELLKVIEQALKEKLYTA